MGDGGKRESERESVNRSRNDAVGNAKYEKDTSIHQRRAGIRTRAEVKDDTVSDSFPAGERREGKEEPGETPGRRKRRWQGREKRGRRDTGRN